MIRLLLVTNKNDARCGAATFTENLVKSLAEYPVEITIKDLTEEAYSLRWNYDILHFNFIPSMQVNESWFRILPQVPKKIYNLHVTQPFSNKDAFTDLFNAVVVHHKYCVEEAPNFIYIPHGILEVEGNPPIPEKLVIGSAGFPQPFKGLDAICFAALEIGDCELVFVMPESRHADSAKAEKLLRDIVKDKISLTIVRDWLTDVEVVCKLRECSVAAFSHIPSAPGVGGAVRMGVAAKIPVVVPDYWHFRDIRDYVYLANFSKPTNLADVIIKAHTERKDCWTPLLADMGWSKVGKMYYDLYSRIVNGG